MKAKPGTHLKFKTTLLSALVAAVCTTSAYADESKKDNENNEIEKISIVGATSNSVITPEDLSNYQAVDLEDVFRTTPSITVGGSLGIAQKVFVRGLEDSMVNVTVDGAPQTSTIFHHIGRVSIEPELLRSVEVQAGAGEATAGSGAVGGAIRFKTKTADDFLAADEQFGGLAKASIFTNDGHKESIALFGRVTDSVDVLASYVTVTRENMEDGDGAPLPGTASDQTLGFVKVNAELSDTQAVSVSYETREEDGMFPKQTNWAPLEGAPLFQSWGERDTLVLNHSLNVNELVNLETTVYQTESSFKRELYTWDAGIKTTGFDIRNSSDISDHTITYGVEHKKDEMSSKSYGEFGGISDEEGSVMGIYAQDHWQITPDLVLSYGLRYDSYELDHTSVKATWIKTEDGTWVVAKDDSGNPITKSNVFSVEKQSGVSKNLGFKYNLSDSLVLSAGYAEALRGRLISDAFTAGEIKFPNADIQPEEVENFELGLEYNDGTWLFEASAYNSTINDVLFDKFKGREGVFYENIGDLESQGFEFVAGFQADQFDVVVSYNINDVELNNMTFLWPDASAESGTKTVNVSGVDVAAYEYGGLGNAVGDSLNLHFNYEVSDALTAGFNLNHVFDLNDIEVFHRSMELAWVDKLETVDKPGYTVLDAYVNYEPIENLNVNLSIQNLLDETYRSHGSVADYGQLKHLKGYDAVKGMNEPGRDIRLSVSYKF